MKTFRVLRLLRTPSIVLTIFLTAPLLVFTGCSSAPKDQATESLSISTDSAKSKRPSWLPTHTVFASENFSIYQEVFKPFPAKGTPEEAEDFQRLYALQTSRTKAQCDQAKVEYIADPGSFIAYLPFKMKEADIQKVTPLLMKVRADSDFIIHHFKDQYARPRPPLQSENLKPCIELPTSMAYPSGHASIGVVLGETLSEIFPKHKKAFKKRGEEFGDYRVLGGVHFPSDVEMGRILGGKVMSEIRKNPAYHKEVKALRGALLKK
jgi:acid phosphatase (class A)